MIASTLFSALLLPALVAAHGYIAKVTIDGTVYQGNTVGPTPSIKSVIRQINSNDPVKGASNPNLNCGQGAALAADVATANPGSIVQIDWVGGTSGGNIPWFHNTGPIMHYMAQCQGSCASYNSSNAEWFKISELGLKPDGKSWYQAELQSSPANVTVPSTLAPGNYLLRSEIIALQLAMTEGGAEFYISCIQLSVGGSQTGTATKSEEVTFPGGYSDTDPGILVPNVYNPGFNYTFPGPQVASFVSSGSGSGNPAGSGTPSANTTGTPSPTPSNPPSSPSPPSLPPLPSSPPSSPTNGSYPPSSVAPSAPTASPTSTGSTTCMKKRSPEAHVVSDKRMHRSRFRSSRQS